jgi:type IV secretion system protein VirB4
MFGVVREPKLWRHGLQQTNLHEFVAMSTPVSEHDTLTRDGDLLRTWRIGGVPFEGVELSRIEARHESLCNALRNLPDARCTVYRHRIQRLTTDRLTDPDSPPFAAAFSRAYQDGLQKEPFLVKEFYLTVLYRPHESARDRRRARAARTRESLLQQTEMAIEAMEDIGALVESTLDDFDPMLLGVRRGADGIHYWEAGEFYAYLINGVWEPVKVPSGPAWKVLPTARVTSGGAELEISHFGRKRFVSVLDMKEYASEADPGSLSALLYLRGEYIETQCISLLPRREAMARLTLQRDQLKASDDVAQVQVDAMDEALERLADGQFGMGEYSYSLAVFGDTAAEARRRAVEARGLVAKVQRFEMVPVDLLSDGAWFAQQPGNLQWRTRKALLSTRAYAALASGHTFLLGKRDRNPWGEALAIMRTPSGYPFHFNLHATNPDEEVDEEGKKLPGNTILLGETGSGKTTVLAALFALSAKWPQPPRIVSFSLDRDTEIVIRAMGGKYHRFEYGEPTGLAPLQRPVTNARIGHWCALVRRCIESDSVPLTPDEIRAIDHAVRSVTELPVEERTFSTVLGFLPRSDAANSLFDRFERWTRGGELGWVFDGSADTIGDAGKHRYLGFDYTAVIDADEVRTPVMMDLLSIMRDLVDGTPLIYHIAEAWKALNDPIFAPFIKHEQKTIRKKNGLGIFDTQEVKDLVESLNGRTMITQSATKIALPNKEGTFEEYAKANFTNAEFDVLCEMGRNGSRDFLVKQRGASTVCQFDLRGMDDELAVLSTSLDNLVILDEVLAEYGEDPQQWLHPFYDRVRQARTQFRKAA